MAIPIPDDVRELLQAPNYVHLSTLRADGSPRNWVVWAGLEGDHILVCTSDAIAKAKDMRRDPRVALSLTDITNPYRMAAIQGRVVEVRADEGLLVHGPDLGQVHRRALPQPRTGSRVLRDRCREGRTADQQNYAKQRSGAPGASEPGAVGLADIIEGVAPTILVGASALGGTFTREVVQTICQATRRPLILPLSAPAAAIEALPADIIAWSGGKAPVATGVQAGPVECDGTTFAVGQLNDVLVYPGLGLGIIASQAAKVTPRMLQAAAAALAEQIDASQPGAPLLPGIHGLRASSALVAEAVVRAAVADQVAAFNPTNPTQAIHDAMWRPAYPDVG